MDNTKEYIRHLSLCSGYEGIGSGLRRVLPNVREIAHVEIEAYAIANLVAKMEANQIHPAPVFTNLKEFPFGKFRGCVDILTGGFPCQPFSTAGKREGTEDPRHLFPYILEGIRECRPKLIFLENVEGIISSKTADGESVLKYVLRSLEELGYRAEAGVFSASEVGAPHQRKRVFIMAYSNSERCEGSKWASIQGEAREPSRHRVGDKLADSKDIGRRRGEDQDGDDGEGVQKQEEEEQPMVWSEAKRCSGDARELADTNSSRGRKDWEQSELWAVGTEQPPTSTWARSPEGTTTQGQEGLTESWPSRPSQEQYKWEEPRVLPQQTQPIMGGAADGTRSGLDSTANRVDRLRLLGNGVVPQVAERAFRVLTARLIC